VRITETAKNGVSWTRKRNVFSVFRGDLTSRLCRGRGGPRRSIDQRHLAENSAWSELLDDLAAPLDLDLARG